MSPVRITAWTLVAALTSFAFAACCCRPCGDGGGGGHPPPGGGFYKMKLSKTGQPGATIATPYGNRATGIDGSGAMGFVLIPPTSILADCDNVNGVDTPSHMRSAGSFGNHIHSVQYKMGVDGHSVLVSNWINQPGLDDIHDVCLEYTGHNPGYTEYYATARFWLEDSSGGTYLWPATSLDVTFK